MVECGWVEVSFPHEQWIRIQAQVCKLPHRQSAILSNISWVLQNLCPWVDVPQILALRPASERVRWGTNYSGHLDMKWHPYSIRAPWFVYSLVGYINANESGQGSGFIWRALDCYLPRLPPLLSVIPIHGQSSVLLNKQVVFQGSHPAPKQPMYWDLISWQWGLPALSLLWYVLTHSLLTGSHEKKPWCWHWMSFPVAVFPVLAIGTEW